jgi:hypothetical protein
MSDEEIQSGTRWSEVIGSALNEMDYGLICVTRSNQAAPWLMFEAGALAKRLDTAHVVPLCIDLAPSDITSPLQIFQGRKLDKDGMQRIVRELHEMSDNPMSLENVDQVFEALWARLDEAIKDATKPGVDLVKAPRTPDDMLAELVTRVRALQQESDRQHGGLTSHDVALLTDLVPMLDQVTRRLRVLDDTAMTLLRAAELAARSTSQSVTSDDASTVSVGERVEHNDYGVGVVLAINETGAEQQAEVDFGGRRLRVPVRQLRLRKP